MKTILSSILLATIVVACGSSSSSGDGRADAPSPPDGVGPSAPASPPSGGAGAQRRPPSCTGARGAGTASCAGNEDCCRSIPVPGGSFLQFGDADFPATVSAFDLDEFEVTAGRIRAWVDATGGALRDHAPAAGAGAHPRIQESGWRTEWNALLPNTRAEVDALLGPEGCQTGADLDDYGAVTWWTPAIDARMKTERDPAVTAANTRDALDRKPIACVPWYVLFAFCAWDGGRLPTNAEWGFAAAGGDQQRPYPWGALGSWEQAPIGNRPNLSQAPLFDPGRTFVVARLWSPANGPNDFPDGYWYTWGTPFAGPHDVAAHIAPVGSRPAGNGRWGHADLAGNVYEWTLDEGPIRPGPCNDCADVAWPSPDGRDPRIERPFPLSEFFDYWFIGGARAIRGGAWDNALGLSNTQTRAEIATYTAYPVGRTYRSLGGRCARDPAR